MIEASPTCVLNSAYLEGPPTGHPSHHRPLVTISSEVDSPISSGSTSTSGAAISYYCEQQQLQPNPGGVQLPSNNRCSRCPINTLSPPAPENEGVFFPTEFLNLPADCKVLNRSKSSNWKSSKFFSKSMNSGEILKGLRKLSLTSMSGDDPDSSTSSKSLKSKLSNFKKRSSCGNEEVSLDVEALEKLSSSAPAATSITGKPLSEKDDGIVCKKEDLKAIICNATKRFPLYSPSKKKNALRQTKSASFEPPQEKKKKEPVRRAGSEETRTRRVTIPTLDVKNLPPPSPKIIDVKSPIKSVSVKPTTPVPATTPVAATKTVCAEPAEPAEVKVEDPSGVSTVKWDETNVVDAVLIGDAIETFLKGSMTATEKKVAFRKNSYEKKS